MSMIWILIANQSEAQIFSAKRLPGSLVLVEILKHEEGAAHARNLISDVSGRVHDRMGSARHRMEPDTGVKEEQRRRFVKSIVDRLETAYLNAEFERLVVVAAPAVLGVVRRSLAIKLRKVVIKEIPKDVIGHDIEKIQKQLERAFELK